MLARRLAVVSFALLASAARTQQAAAIERDLTQAILACEELSYRAPAEALQAADAVVTRTSQASRVVQARARLCRSEVLLRNARAEAAVDELRALAELPEVAAGLRARVILRLAGAMVLQARVAAARPLIDEAAALIAEHGSDQDRALLLALEGVVLQCEARFEQALAKYQAAWQTAAQRRPYERAQFLYNIATIHMATGDRAQAGTVLAQARELAVGGHQLALILAAQADCLPADAPIAERRALFEQCLQLERGIASRSGEALFLRRLGALDVSEERLDDAVARFSAALDLARGSGNDESIVSSTIALADLHLHRGDATAAIALTEQAMPMAQALGMPVVEQHVVNTLTGAYERGGDFQRAFATNKRLREIEAQLADASRSSEVTRLRAEHAAELREREHAVELEHEVLLRNLAIAATAGVAVLLLVLLRTLRQRGALVLQLVARAEEVQHAQRQMSELGDRLGEAIADVKRLTGLLPICSHCKSIRDEGGHWHQLEAYVASHSEANFTHGICPHCMQRHFPES